MSIAGNALYFYAREDFWYQTTFTLLADTDPKQLHATITHDSSPDQEHIGTVVVALFEIEGERLTLGVVEDFEGPPSDAVVGDWERVMDLFNFEKGQPGEKTRPPQTHDKINGPALEDSSPPPSRSARLERRRDGA